MALEENKCLHGVPINYACPACIEGMKSKPYTEQERVDGLVNLISDLVSIDDDAPKAWGLEQVFRALCRYEATVVTLEAELGAALARCESLVDKRDSLQRDADFLRLPRCHVCGGSGTNNNWNSCNHCGGSGRIKSKKFKEKYSKSYRER